MVAIILGTSEARMPVLSSSVARFSQLPLVAAPWKTCIPIAYGRSKSSWR
jgi:hypothetical protein